MHRVWGVVGRFIGGGLLGAVIVVLAGGPGLFGLFAAVGFVLGGLIVVLLTGPRTVKLDAVPKQTDVLEQIQKLGRLRDEGLLTDDEFNAKKAELLQRI